MASATWEPAELVLLTWTLFLVDAALFLVLMYRLYVLFHSIGLAEVSLHDDENFFEMKFSRSFMNKILK